VKRAPTDHSQALRPRIQLGFLALNVWIGIEFYLFVRYYETGGRSTFAVRPAGVEGWLPIASLMNLKVLLATGRVPGLHAAGMFLLIAFVGISWIFRKGFCGWLCPVGTVSEYLWRFGRRICGRNFRLPRADIALRSLKYILLGLFLYAVGAMPVPAIRAFLERPIRHGGRRQDAQLLPLSGPQRRHRDRHSGDRVGLRPELLVPLSLPVRRADGLGSLASPLRIRRDPNLCIDCGKCAKACPSVLPVDRLIAIRSAECTGCLECVAVCPAAAALCLSTPRGKRAPAWVVAAGIAALFVGICGFARLTGHWQTNLSGSAYFELITHANEFTHP
jgi:polyferredoxin